MTGGRVLLRRMAIIKKVKDPLKVLDSIRPKKRIPSIPIEELEKETVEGLMKRNLPKDFDKIIKRVEP